VSRDDPLFGADATWSDDDPTTSAASPAPERYEVREPLGEGASGIVEAVYDQVLDRVVARKRPKPGSNIDPEAFLREARLTAGLQHPTVVRIYDAGVDEAGPFYTMEQVDGETLRDAWHGLPAAQRLRFLPVVRAAAEGMAVAHEAGIVHRDLKPANLMLGRLGRAWVLDFGLGRQAGDVPSQLAGTPRYMSPEQARGEPATPGSDVWSLGAILCELLAGRPPYEGRSDEVLEALRQSRPPRLPGGDAPPELVAVARKALSPDPAERYAHAGALAADLVAYEAGRAVSAHRYGLWEGLTRWARLHRRTLGLVGVATVSLAAVGIGSAALQFRATLAERDRAVAAEAEAEQALALSLEARARSLVDRPEVSVPLATRALALSPGLPWARGVLAAHRPFTPAAPAWTRLDLRSCVDSYELPDRLIVRCGDTLHEVRPDGARVLWTGEERLMFAGGRLWHPQRGQLTPLQWSDGELVPTADPPLPLGLLRGRVRRTPIPDAPLVGLHAGGVSYLHTDGTTSTEPRPWEDAPYHLSCHPTAGCLVMGEITWRCDERIDDCQPYLRGNTAMKADWRHDGAVVAQLNNGQLVVDSGHGPQLLAQPPQAAEVRAVRWVGQRLATLDVTGTVQLQDARGGHRASVQSDDTAPRGLASIGDTVVVWGLSGLVAVDTSQLPSRSHIVGFPDGVTALAADGDRLWVGADGKLWGLDADGRLTVPPPSGEPQSGVIKSIIAGSPLWLAVDRPMEQPAVDVPHEVTPARRVARTEGRRWVADFSDPLTATPPLSQRWSSRGDLAAASDRVAFESAPGVLTVLDDHEQVVYQSPPAGDELWAIALSADGQVVVYADPDHQLHRVHLPTGEHTVWSTGHRGPIATIALSDDARRVLSGSWDGTARVFDADGELLLGLEGHDARIVAATFLGDHRAATGSWDRTLRLWDLSAVP